MNNLLYNARMALRDLIDVNIFTKGNDRVYLSVSPDLSWDDDDVAQNDQQREERELARRAHTQSAVQAAIDHLRDMDLVLAGGESAITALMESESVEIVRKVD